MSTEENLRVIDQALEAFNARDWNRFLSLHVESVIDHEPTVPEPIKGRKALGEFLKGFVVAFPDLNIRKERSFGQGDWACAELLITGTNRGPMPGPGGKMIPATNKAIRVKEGAVFKMDRGQVAEIHEYYDVAGMMSQLGLM